MSGPFTFILYTAMAIHSFPLSPKIESEGVTAANCAMESEHRSRDQSWNF
jgi:hypothetical protein